MSFDPYAKLGVSKGANQEQIKTAYRKLAKKLHPDLNPGDKKIENEFKEVNKAYELVGTPEMRAKFDRGETAEQQQEFWHATGEPRQSYSFQSQGIDPEMFANIFGQGSFGGFAEQFGGAAGTRGRRRRGGPMPGADQHYAMEVDFNSSILGGERELTLPTGKKLRVKIPPGIKSGQKLRLAGQGEPGFENGPPGDVYIEVNVLPSPTFKRDGDNLETELPLSLDEAVLGSEVRVSTIDGHVMLKIPAGISSGAKLRIKGKGVPASKGKRGDQYAIIKIVMPSKIDEKLADAIREWKKDHHYNPRA